MKLNILSGKYSFALLYALLVTLATHAVTQLPVFLQMEYAIYDPLQRWFTIDTADDCRHRKYERELNNIYGINLDDSFFIKETNRVDRARLSDLLIKLNDHQQFNVVFLDFLFEPLSSNKYQSNNADSLLMKSMELMNDRLVLPFSIEMESIGVFDEFNLSHIINRSELIYKPKYSGFTAPLYLRGDNIFRYHQFRVEDTSEISAVHALINAVHVNKAEQWFKNIPNKFEINFILRNKKQFGSKDALHISDSQQVLDWTKEEVKNNLMGKVIFVSRFKPKKDHMGKSMDSFNTPIKSNLNGIYLLINAYLNIVNNTHLGRASGWIVFIINFLLAIVCIYYFNLKKDQGIRSVSEEVKEIAVVIFIFFGFLIGLYIFFSLKFPFVISTVAFVKLKYLINGYDSLVERLPQRSIKFSNSIS